ncbi:hypothetical protein ACFQHW_03275 [Lapidilactobacillus achengensis]|uniref:XRE family transcriptional regulator n=1 Tax=Lapidilactobacillus achengensis TaxID=2486000 RepID=A0ABW1UN16_9LACO|nr:hypothetical protein [Lapidilactobacillus achengensis]
MPKNQKIDYAAMVASAVVMMLLYFLIDPHSKIWSTIVLILLIVFVATIQSVRKASQRAKVKQVLATKRIRRKDLAEAANISKIELNDFVDAGVMASKKRYRLEALIDRKFPDLLQK